MEVRVLEKIVGACFLDADDELRRVTSVDVQAHEATCRLLSKPLWNVMVMNLDDVIDLIDAFNTNEGRAILFRRQVVRKLLVAGVTELSVEQMRGAFPDEFDKYLYHACRWLVGNCRLRLADVYNEQDLKEVVAADDERPSFKKWMDDVDSHIGAITGVPGLTHMDLADQMYRDWYDDGCSAKQAACDALESEGFG
jgi:hypothetical protein